MSAFRFELSSGDGATRRGRVTTAHSSIETPAFMPVGTAASVKALLPEQVRGAGAEIILGNTYHLMLRPGAQRIARLGGLHRFMGWDGAVLTDSGGYQVMSLGPLRTLSEDGVIFTSHIDGSKHALSPERAVEIQLALGADIQMALDECTPYPSGHEAVAASMELSMRWAARARRSFLESGGGARHAQFGIVQGGTFPDLRQRSLAAVEGLGFEGLALGGLAVGESQDEMFRVLDQLVPHMPAAVPRYLMGVGKPDDIVGAVLRGIDMFDCVLPTRSGRHGQAFTWDGPINLKNAGFAEDESPLDADSLCRASNGFSKAYLHHLVRAGEMLASVILSWHNIAFYQQLMAGLRLACEAGETQAFARGFLARYHSGNDRRPS
jgi:queuine tRNA-ribosyltransferase